MPAEPAPRHRGQVPWARLPAAGLVSSVVLAMTAGAVVAPAAARADPGVLVVDRADPACSATASPYCTISQAAAAVQPGETVQVSAGTYAEGVTVARSGVAGAPITFRATPGTVTVTGGDRGFYLSGRSFVTISGFAVTATTRNGIYVVNGSDITLTDNRVTGAGARAKGQTAAGIYLGGTSGAVVAGNVVADNSDSGIYLGKGTVNARVLGNTAYGNARGYQRAAPGIDVRSGPHLISGNITHDNEDSGLQFYAGAHDNVVVNNVTYNNGDHGIDDYGAPNQTIVGNTVFNNVTAGINLEGPSGAGSTGGIVRNNISVDNGLTGVRTRSNIRVDSMSIAGTTLDHNLTFIRPGATQVSYIWGRTGYATVSAFRAASGQEASGIQADPGWVDPGAGDFRLAASSPAIDSADSAAPSGAAADLAGNPRVDDPATPNTGAGPRAYDDRGALEYQPAATGPRPPTARLGVTPPSGPAPLVVTADASATTDPDGDIASYRFDFGDGTAPVSQPTGTASHSFAGAGTFTVTVTVTDATGLAGQASGTVVATAAGSAPVARLALSPPSGPAPLAVSADGTASSDPDGDIASYRFDFGDGSAPVSGAAATANHSYPAPGNYVVTLTVTDGRGASNAVSGPVTVSAPPGGELVANPGFESDLAGWSASGTPCTLARVAGGHTGGWAATVTNSTSATTTCQLNDSPNWVRTTVSGTYTATVWVRADSPATLRLRLREYAGSTAVGSATATVQLSAGWQPVTVAYPAGAPGSSTLDLNVYVSGAPAGFAFAVDDASVTLG